jgi:hypothetical protein
MRTHIAAVALMLVTMAFASEPAGAIDAELAKKCRAMAIKAYPPQPAGSKSRHAEAERAYFRNCVARGGNMPDGPAKGLR